MGGVLVGRTGAGGYHCILKFGKVFNIKYSGTGQGMRGKATILHFVAHDRDNSMYPRCTTGTYWIQISLVASSVTIKTMGFEKLKVASLHNTTYARLNRST